MVINTTHWLPCLILSVTFLAAGLAEAQQVTQIGNDDKYSCHTRGSVIDMEHVDSVNLDFVVGGNTQSQSLITGLDLNGCLDQPRAFFHVYARLSSSPSIITLKFSRYMTDLIVLSSEAMYYSDILVAKYREISPNMSAIRGSGLALAFEINYHSTK